LHSACLHGANGRDERAECVQMLLEANAPIEACNAEGSTALGLAAEAGHVECMQQLIAFGSAVNAADRLSRTPLYRACRYGRTDAVHVLLACSDIDMNATSDEAVLPESEEAFGETVAPRDICGWRGHTTTLKLLIEARADIGPRDALGVSIIASRTSVFSRGAPLSERQLRCIQLLQAEATAMALLAEETDATHAVANVQSKSKGGGGKANSKRLRSKHKSAKAAGAAEERATGSSGAATAERVSANETAPSGSVEPADANDEGSNDGDDLNGVSASVVLGAVASANHINGEGGDGDSGACGNHVSSSGGGMNGAPKQLNSKQRREVERAAAAAAELSIRRAP